jgi:hypothetical protein
MLCTEHAFDGRVGRRTPAWLSWLVTFNLVCFGWILFRSGSLDLFWTYLGRLVEPGPATLWTVPVVLAIAVVIVAQLLPPRRVEGFQLSVERLRPALLAVGLAATIIVVGATVPSQGVPPFIYFQF